MCALLHIKKTRTTAYHPESDGQTERFNRTLRHMLRTVVAENLQWDDMQPSLLLAYRSSVHASTGYTPHYLLFRCEARLPVDVVYGLLEPSRLPVPAHVAELQERLETAHRLTRHHLQAAQLHQKEFYDRRCHGVPYSVGDLVWLLCPAIRPGESGKFHRPWRGPCRVTEVIGQGNYRVSNLDTDSSQVVHFNRAQALSRSSPPRTRCRSLDHPSRRRLRRARTPKSEAITHLIPGQSQTTRLPCMKSRRTIRRRSDHLGRSVPIVCRPI